MGFDVPWYEQFFNFLGGIVGGRTFGAGDTAIRCAAPCFGYDFQNNIAVLDEIGSRIEVSFSVAFGAAVLWLFSGVGLGVLSALRRGTALDRITMGIAMTGVSMPAYLAGMLGITIFAFLLDVVPKTGYVPIGDDVGQWAWHLVLPWFVLAFLHAAIYARLTRGQMLETLGEDYIRTARAKGLRESRVVAKHGLRAALTPIVTIFGMDFAGLLGGALITETVFGLNGIGKMAADSITKNDQPVIMGVTLLAAFLVVVGNMVVDLLYTAIDPRVRVGSAA